MEILLLSDLLLDDDLLGLDVEEHKAVLACVHVLVVDEGKESEVLLVGLH